MNHVRLLHRCTLLVALASVFLSIEIPDARGADSPAFIRRIRIGRPAGIYAPGEALKWHLTLVNPSTTLPLADARLAWAVSTWEKTHDAPSPGASGEQSVAVPPGDNVVVAIEYMPAALGWHEMTFELRDSGGALLERQVRTFSVGTVTRGAARYFRYGICQNLRRHLNTPLFDKMTALAGHLGVDILRTELALWESTQPEEGQWRWQAADRVIDALAPLGIEIQPILAYSPRWASTGNTESRDWKDWNKAAPRLAPWHTYVRAVVGRYGDRARHWEIWNEPDISFWRSPTAQYTGLFDTTSALIREISPDARVLNGGFAMGSRQPNPDFLQEFISTADKAHWDVLAYHDYHTFSQFLARRARVDPLLAALRPGVPLWINEGGYHTLLAGGEREQALTLVKKIATAPARGITAYFWYNLHDDGTDPRNSEHHFGLTRHGGDPKPAWSAYQNLVRELGDARYLRSMSGGSLPPGTWAHLYEFPERKASVQHTLVLWQEGAARQTPVWIGVGSETSVRGIVDIMGNPVPASLARNGAVFSLSGEPVYIRLQSSSGHEPQLALKPLLETPPLVVLVPGEDTSLILAVNNPLDRPATAALALSTNDSRITLQPQSEQFLLPPSGRVQLTVLLRSLPDTSESTLPEAAVRIDLRLSIAEAGLDLPARIPVTLARLVPQLPRSDTPWRTLAGLPSVATLDHRDNIHNLYSAEPLPAMHWHGPDDLSAVVRIATDDDSLFIEVVARDDVHHQTDLRGRLWDADSLQVGIQLKDTDADYIEVGLARDNGGEVGGWVFARTADCLLPLGGLDSSIPREVVRNEAAATTTYRLQLPWRALGSPNGPLSGGIRLGLVVNDNDGQGRKQWVKLSDGLGEQKAPALWQVFSCQQRRTE